VGRFGVIVAHHGRLGCGIMMWNFIYLQDQFKIDVTRVIGKGRNSIDNLIMLLLDLHISDTYA
jgi:hypothetical protein